MDNVTRLDSALTQLVVNHPFYASIALRNPVETRDSAWFVQAAGFPAVGATDGRSIFINHERVNELSIGQLVGLLQHEVEHIARLHSSRLGMRDVTQWNCACDHVINLSILEEGGALPDGGLHDPQYTGLSEEQVYDRLESEPDGVGGGGNDIDALLPPPPDFSEDDVDSIKEAVVQAANIAKARGKMPGHLQHLLDQLAPPSKDWRQELDEFVTATCTSDYSWARPNRMYVTQGVYLPGLASVDQMGALAVVIDTSGSVSNDELRQYFGDLCAAVEAVNPLALHMVYVDSDVSHTESFDNPRDAEVRAVAARLGGGGTDMTVGLDWVDDNVPDVAAAIVFTDGGTPFGSERQYPVLWAISGRTEAPWGRTITIPTST